MNNNVIIEDINNNEGENNMSNSTAFHNCHAITAKGDKCKSGHGRSQRFVLVNGGKAIHEDMVKAGNMPGWYRVELPFCKTHVNMLLKGRKISVQNVRKSILAEEPQYALPVEPDRYKVEVNDEQFAMADKPKHIKTKEVKCGKCRKNGISHPYHASIDDVKACYMAK